MDDETKEMLENAVFQQVFNTQNENQIMGKNPENKMQLTMAEPLLNQFLEELGSNLSKLGELDIKGFIKIFEKRFSIDLSSTNERIMNNFEGMGGIEVVKGQDTLINYMTLTKLLEAVREYAYTTIGLARIEETYRIKHNIHDLKPLKQGFYDKIQNLAALNEENISLLYNMSFIAILEFNYAGKK